MKSLLRRALRPRTCASSVRNLDGSLLWCAERTSRHSSLHCSREGIKWGGRMSSGIAVVVHPPYAGPVRPDEEPTPPCQSPTCNLSLSACVCGNPYGKEPTP